MTIINLEAGEPKMTSKYTLQDVCDRVIAQANGLREQRRFAGLLSDAEVLSKWTGKPLSELPADIPLLRSVFESLDIASADIGYRMARRVEKAVVALVVASRLVPTAFIRKYTSKHLKAILARRPGPKSPYLITFCRYCEANAIELKTVCDQTVSDFMEHMRQASANRLLDQIPARIARAWNELAKAAPDLGLGMLTVPSSRQKRTRIPVTRMTPEFQEDERNYLAFLVGERPGPRGFRPRKVSARTVESVRERLNHASTAAIKSGVPIERLTCLATLADREIFLKILRYRHEQTRGAESSTTYYMATFIIQVAADWGGFPTSEIVWLKAKRNKLPRPEFRITEKNLALVHRFDDQETVRRWLECPDRIERDADERLPNLGWRLPAYQASLGLDLVSSTALRLSNLVDLKYDVHVFLRDDGVSRILIPKEYSKTHCALEFEMPDSLAQRFKAYRAFSNASFPGAGNGRVFYNADGSAKHYDAVASLLKTYFKRYVGFHMSPHTFRHLWAKLILDDKPGAFEEVQRFLGHRSLEASANFYSDFEQSRAGAWHMSHVEAALRSASPTDGGV